MRRSSRPCSFFGSFASFAASGALATILLGTAAPGIAFAAPESAAPATVPANQQAARAAIEEQRYDDARSLVKDDLASPLAGRRAPALEIAGVSMLLEGRAAEALPFVHALYELAPAFALSDESLPPRVTDAFAAEAARPHSRAVSLAFRSGEDGSFVLETSGRARLSVSCRQGQSDFGSVALINLTPTRRGFRLPVNAVNACFALALDEDGLPLGRLGSRRDPLVLKPEPKPSGTVLSRWWFWTTVGAAVAGGVVLAYVETRPDNRTLPAADVTASGRKTGSP